MWLARKICQQGLTTNRTASTYLKGSTLQKIFISISYANMPKRKNAMASSSQSSSSVSKRVKSNETGPETDDVAQCTDDTLVKRSKQGKSFNWKIVSWNVNGIRAALKKNVMDYFASEQCDILCLQETKCNDEKFPVELSDWPVFPYKYYSTSDQDGYAGVALFSKTEPNSVEYGLGLEHHDSEGRVITAYFNEFIIVNAYVPNAGRGLKRLDYRINWDKDFRQYLQKLDQSKPVVLCGDLNVAHNEIDIENPKSNVKNAGFTPQERANFTQLLEKGFVDSFRLLYPNQRRCYTFWSYLRDARSKNIGWRLDYFVISQRLKDMLCDSQIRSQVMGSDHCPIVLYLAL